MPDSTITVVENARRADEIAPYLRYADLSDWNNSVAANIILFFSEPVFAGDGVIFITDEFGVRLLELSVRDNPRVKIEGDRVIIDPPQDLAYATTYKISMSEGALKDAAGNLSHVKLLDPYGGGTAFTTKNSPFPVNLNGTAAADDLRGGDSDDQLNGLGGNDRLEGFGGRDVLDGGAGDDDLHSADGNDVLRGGDGDDELMAGWGGNAKLEPDRLEGGPGDDRLYGGRADDTLDGGSGDDWIHVGAWNDDRFTATVIGGDGNDRITLSSDGDYRVNASGGAGRDTYELANTTKALLTVSDFVAGPGGDILDLTRVFTGDQLRANPFGAAGMLRLTQLGNDTLLQYDPDGPAGVAPPATLALLTGVTAAKLGTANFGGGLNPSGATGGLTLTGTAGNDTLKGDVLDDTLRGLGGDDVLDGREGSDLLEGGDGVDVLYGYDGDDKLLGEGGNDKLLGDFGDDELDGGAGEDQLYDDWGNNTMRGGEGHDYIVSGGSGTNVLDGGNGHDRLISRGGNDTLKGGAGNDTLEFSPPYESSISSLRNIVMDGGADADTFHFNFSGSAGVFVRAAGGGGSDVFVMSTNSVPGQLVITDFATGPGGDQLNVNAYLATSGPMINPFDAAAGNLRLIQRDSNAVLQVKVPAETDASGFRDLAVLENVKTGSLTADNFVLGVAPDGASSAVRLTGGAGNDVLQGGYMNDVLIGGAGADTLYGYFGDDRLEGGDGDDVLVPGSGKNELIGGAGLDTVRYDGINSFGFVTVKPDGWWVGHPIVWGTNKFLAHTLDGIERVRFDDRTWALDIDGTAGKVYRLYQAAFDRTPDQVGVGFWISKVDQGMPMSQVLDFFVNSPEFASLYGAKPTNTEIVTRFYNNVLDREPDAVGKAFWISVLDQGKVTVADVLAQFSESPENQEAVAKIIGNGFPFQEYI